MGVFFGYREDPADPDTAYRFFLISLDDRGTAHAPFGQLNVGSGLISPRNGVRGGMFDLFRPLFKDKSIIAFPAPEQWHRIVVRVVDDRVTITADQAQPFEFEMSRLRQVDPQIGEKLNPRGALGIWSRNGVGLFRNATVTALPSAN